MVSSDSDHANTCEERNRDGLHLVPLSTADSYAALLQQISSVLGPMSPNGQESQIEEHQSRFMPLIEVPNRTEPVTGQENLSSQATYVPVIGTTNEGGTFNLELSLSPFSTPVLSSPLNTPKYNVNEADGSHAASPFITEALLSPCQIVAFHPQTSGICYLEGRWGYFFLCQS